MKQPAKKEGSYPLRIEKGLKAQLIALAKKEERSLNYYINKVLRNHIKPESENVNTAENSHG